LRLLRNLCALCVQKIPIFNAKTTQAPRKAKKPIFKAK
jgi:hypothetical protein